MKRIPRRHPANQAENMLVFLRLQETSGYVRAIAGTADRGDMALFIKIDFDFEQLRASTVLGHNDREVGGANLEVLRYDSTTIERIVVSGFMVYNWETG